MTDSDIIRAAMKSCGWNQETLAIKAGYKTQSAISNRLGRKNGMRVDVFVKLLAAMGYEVVIKSTSPATNKNKWVLNLETQEHGNEKKDDVE